MKKITQQLKKESCRIKVFNTLLLLIGISFFSYGAGIAATTVSIAEANTHTQDINELQTQIAELEVEYFEIINTLSMDEAKKYGFSELPNVQYAHVDAIRSVAYNL